MNTLVVVMLVKLDFYHKLTICVFHIKAIC